MATVYSLVCFGGLSGKTVTFTDAGDVVNLTNHGLRQGVTGIVFSTTGSLPTGITAGVTYYPRDGADANKFTIYPTKADALSGTNQVTFSGAGSGTHTVKSAYMLGLSSAQLARYGSSGSERIFPGVKDWRDSRAGSSIGVYDTEVCEIGEAFTETISSTVNLNLACASTVVHSKIGNNRTTAFHYGIVGIGYVIKITSGNTDLLNINSYNCVVDGLDLLSVTGNTQGVSIYQAMACVCNNIIRCTEIYNSNGIILSTIASKIYNNVIFGFYGGILSYQYFGKANYVYNNLIAKCNVGMRSGGDAVSGFYYNNISVGNMINWDVKPRDLEGAAYNFGTATDIPWNVGLSTAIVSMVTTDGVDFVSFSTNNFTPASATSKQVESGMYVYNGYQFDITDKVRPNYINGSTDKWDAGPYEYDHGNGIAPVQVPIYISGIAEGSVLAIYKTDGSTIVSPTTIGSSGSYSITYSYTGDTQITVVVRKATGGTKYLPYSAPGLITSAGFALIVNQVIDGVLNG